MNLNATQRPFGQSNIAVYEKCTNEVGESCHLLFRNTRYT